MEETAEQIAAREAEEAAAAEAQAAETAAAEAREAELAAMTPEERASAEAQAAGADTTAEVTVQIGDDTPEVEEKAPEWVRDVRKRNRELEKEVKELKRAQQTTQAQAAGKKPEMSDADIDYDAEKFEKRYAEWTERKRKSDDEAAQIEEQQKKEQTTWQAKLDAYGTAKESIKVPDLDEAEALVHETLSEKQLAIIVKGAKNPALLVYALGKNVAKLQELSKMGDLVEFAFAVANVESQLKVTKKPAPPSPEKKVEGSAPKSGVTDNTLDRLRAEAERTGDYTKVTQYKRQKQVA